MGSKKRKREVRKLKERARHDGVDWKALDAPKVDTRTRRPPPMVEALAMMSVLGLNVGRRREGGR